MSSLCVRPCGWAPSMSLPAFPLPSSAPPPPRHGRPLSVTHPDPPTLPGPRAWSRVPVQGGAVSLQLLPRVRACGAPRQDSQRERAERHGRRAAAGLHAHGRRPSPGAPQGGRWEGALAACPCGGGLRVSPRESTPRAWPPSPRAPCSCAPSCPHKRSSSSRRCCTTTGTGPRCTSSASTCGGSTGTAASSYCWVRPRRRLPRALGAEEEAAGRGRGCHCARGARPCRAQRPGWWLVAGGGPWVWGCAPAEGVLPVLSGRERAPEMGVQRGGRGALLGVRSGLSPSWGVPGRAAACGTCGVRRALCPQVCGPSSPRRTASTSRTSWRPSG